MVHPSGCRSRILCSDKILLPVLLSGRSYVEFNSQIKRCSGKYFKETKKMIKIKIKEAITAALILITFGLIMAYFYQLLFL